MPGVGIWEMLVVGLVVLLVFGPKRLPEMGRSMGRGMREFKDSISGNGHDDALASLAIDPLMDRPVAVVVEPVDAEVHVHQVDEREIA